MLGFIMENTPLCNIMSYTGSDKDRILYYIETKVKIKILLEWLNDNWW